MFILINVHPMVGVQFLATIGKASSTQWWVSEGSYSWSVTSSIVGPSLDSVLPRTILPMDVITVSRYTDPVESSLTILLALILEILDVKCPVRRAHLLVYAPATQAFKSKPHIGCQKCQQWGIIPLPPGTLG